MTTSPTVRMHWVDAMRGFSMIVVVLGHVLLKMELGGYSSVISSVLLTFRMPLFFFVSGFFSYRAIKWWTSHRIGDILKRKVQAQIICTILFFSLFSFCETGRVNFANGFEGYWFTIVLFQMYVIYLLLSACSRLIKRDFTIPGMIIVSTVFVLILAAFRGDSWAWNFFCWENLTKYTQHFTLGLICSRYRDKFFSILNNNWFATTAICGWIVCMVLWYWPFFQGWNYLAYSFVQDIAVRYFALMTVVMLFFRHADTFSRETNVSRLFRFIGRRTLDIYMIHYFFLPNLSFIHDWLEPSNMIAIQILLSGIVTIVVVALSLLVSSILRQSTTLRQWLFGVKMKTPDTPPPLTNVNILSIWNENLTYDKNRHTYISRVA